MKKQIKLNWQTSVFTTIVSLVIMFAASTPAFAQMTYKVGDKIEVLYQGGKWYKAQIIEVKDGQFKVHYDGYGDYYDEWVKTDRMRSIDGKSPTDNQNNSDNQAQNQPDKNSRATYKVGDEIEVLYYNTWTSAKIIEAKNGQYKIRYPVGGEGYDEWVKPDRLRQIKSGVPTVKPNDADNKSQNQTNEKRTDNQTNDKPKPTTKANEYGTRDPRTCEDKKAPTKGAITAALAAKYVICDSEKVSGQYLYLVENVKVEIGGGRLYSNRETRGFTEIDVRFPIYAIRGSLVSYQCYREDESFPHSKPGKNCIRKNEPEAKGDCYKTLFGEWRCYMSDLSYKNENYFPESAPPKP